MRRRPDATPSSKLSPSKSKLAASLRGWSMRSRRHVFSWMVHRRGFSGVAILSQSMDDHHRRGRVIHPKSPAQTRTGSTPSLLDTAAADSLVIWTFS